MSIRMQRLARVRLPVAVAAAVGCLACRDTSVASSPPLDRVVAIAVIPPVVSVGPGETQAFTAGDVTAGGDTVPGAVVEWHATGGTITSAGVYTAGSDPGTFSVTATRLGGGVLPGRAGISVIHRVVAVIRIQPDTATLPLQGSWQLFATAFDSAGHPLSSARITWASDAPAVGAVDSNGVVTGLTAGTATITAASQGQTASAVISVVPPGSGPWPNEPQAFTIVSDNPFNLLNAPGWQLVDNTQNLVTLALDPHARLSPPSVLQYSFPVGFPGGIGPGAEALELQGLRQVFVGIWWKVSNPWQGHPSNVNKIEFLFPRSGGDIYLAMYGSPGGPYELRVLPQFPGLPSEWLVPNVTRIPVTLGEWHRIEWLLAPNTTTNPPNGIVRWWLDGQLIADYGNVQFPDAPMAVYKVSAIWGGVGSAKSENDFYWYDHVHISGR